MASFTTSCTLIRPDFRLEPQLRVRKTSFFSSTVLESLMTLTFNAPKMMVVVNISINEKNHRLADLLAPALRKQPAAGPRHKTTGPLPPPYIPPSLGGQPGQTPPPKLNVVIQIVGSRGDVQPFVALGQVLRIRTAIAYGSPRI